MADLDSDVKFALHLLVSILNLILQLKVDELSYLFSDRLLGECLSGIDPSKARHCGLLYSHIVDCSSSDLIADQIKHLVQLVSGKRSYF